jgi:hypothetical protein
MPGVDVSSSIRIFRLDFPCDCAIVLHGTMNVTLKLPEHLCREARHRAVDESKSLSAWMAALVARELQAPARIKNKSLLEMLGDPATAARDFELPDRKADVLHHIAFP